MAATEKKPFYRKYFTEGLDRITMFSDGVFAIAITLLVLEIHVPDLTGHEGQLTDELWKLLWPKIGTYAISFLVIGTFWAGHHRLFLHIKRYDRRLIWLNNFYLMLVAFQPFPTAVLGEYGSQTAAVVFYSAVQILTTLFRLAVWVYATFHHRLVDDDLDDRYILSTTLTILSTIVIFGITIGLAFINADLAKYFWLFLAVDNFIIGLIYPAGRRAGLSYPEE